MNALLAVVGVVGLGLGVVGILRRNPFLIGAGALLSIALVFAVAGLTRQHPIADAIAGTNLRAQRVEPFIWAALASELAEERLGECRPGGQLYSFAAPGRQSWDDMERYHLRLQRYRYAVVEGLANGKAFSEHLPAGNDMMLASYSQGEERFLALWWFDMRGLDNPTFAVICRAA